MTNKNKNGVQLEVYSDIICPWCYVGKARLDKALDSLKPQLNVEVSWKPFELNPLMPSQGADRKEYLTRKFGSSDFSAMQARISEAGAEDGLQFNFSEIKRTPNTFNAHRLLWFAQSSGKQHELSRVLFQKYFTEAVNIGDVEVLVSAGKEAGLPTKGVREFLESDKGVNEVKAEERAGRLLGINAVPAFVIDGEVIASGALPAAELARLIEESSLAKHK